MTHSVKKKRFPRKHRTLYFFLVLILAVLGAAAYHYRTELEMRIIHYKPQPAKTVELGRTQMQLQELNSPEITSYDVDKILDFLVRDGKYYIALRSQSGDSTAVRAFQYKDGGLLPDRSFGDKGTFTIPDKMILSVNLSSGGDIYYVKKGLHTLRSGNDIISLKGATTATRIALTPDGQKAILYGNDNFTLAEIKDGAFENNKPGFLHNRAKPFSGGLNLVQITSDGTIWGGGRVKPNGVSIIASFPPRSTTPRQIFGSDSRTDKDSIINLVDMAVLDKYVAAIDGFTLKLWTKKGQYLGSFNSSALLGSNLNCAKLAVVDGNTLGILAFVRSSQTRLIDIKIFTLRFPG